MITPARDRGLAILVTGRWLGYRAAPPVLIDEGRGIAARAAELVPTDTRGFAQGFLQ
ncbi:MAG: hypothetical protein ACREC9_12920 [Methylocella sp.]